MARSRKKSKTANSLGLIADFVEVVDATFERLTGKNIAAWLKEFQQQPRELPQGEQAAPQQPVMPLADAYAILGLPSTASLQQVKERYRSLARMFHPDSPGGYEGAMVLLNNSYERILKGKG